MLKNMIVGTLLKSVFSKAKDEIVEEFVADKLPVEALKSDNPLDDLIDYLGDAARDEFEDLVDDLIAKVEDKAVASESKWDDILVLPLCKIIRSALRVPDGED